MKPPATLRRLFEVRRTYGVHVAWNVIRSKILGALRPSAALPSPPAYTACRRLSFLIRVEEHEPATLEAVVKAVRCARGALDVVVCAGSSTRAVEASSLASRLRGACPWIRVVSATAAVDEGTAASWTVEQATGQYVAVLARGFAPTQADFARLVETLERDCNSLAVGLFSAGDADAPRGPVLLLALRKSFYLAEFPLTFPMTAPVLFETLARSGTPATEIFRAR